MWTTTAQAISDLRRLISDDDTDKLCDMKLVFGKIDGTNTRFKTFERRRVTDFTVAPVAPSPEAIYLNNVALANTAIATDDLTSGSLTLVTAPVDGDELRATYYYRWFFDVELDQFLKTAMQWLGMGSTYTNTPEGLIPAVLHYAAAEAYSRLALWWSTKISNTYLLEDAPDPQNQGVIESYKNLAKEMEEKAGKYRAGYYTRQDQALAPRFGVQRGAVRTLTPRR